MTLTLPSLQAYISGDMWYLKKTIKNMNIEVLKKTSSLQPHLTSTPQSTDSVLVTEIRSFTFHFFIPCIYMYIYTISWNMPNKNQTKRSTSNLNSGMIKPIFSVVYFQITNMTRYFIQIQFHLWNKLKTIQLVKFKQHSQEY